LLNTHVVCQSDRKITLSAAIKYKNHRFPVEIISHAGGVLDMEAMVPKLLILQNFRRRISTSGTPPPFV